MELDRQSPAPDGRNIFSFPFSPLPYCRDMQVSVFRVHLTSRKRGIVAGIKMSNSINPSTLIGADSRTCHRKKGKYNPRDATRLKGEHVDGPIAGNGPPSHRLEKLVRERQNNLEGYCRSRPLLERAIDSRSITASRREDVVRLTNLRSSSE